MTTSPRSTLALRATLPAPTPPLATALDKTSALPGARTTGTNSVLPHLSIDASGAHFEPATGPRYVALKTLGEGGMGEVALVEDRDIGRMVARKRLLPGSCAESLLRFVDEVRVVGQLDHPGIVPIHDVGIDEQGEFFFVMKYVEGETLEAVIERLRAGDAATVAAWDTTRRIQLFRSLLNALSYAHDRGVLHRDLKPANVMIGRHGEVMLMDWGVARRLGSQATTATRGPSRAPARGTLSSTAAGALIGTPLYMSPEQAAGVTEELDARSDLYTACVVFHELLALEHLHEDAPDLTALLERIITFRVPAATRLASRYGLPIELGYFLHRGLQPSPADRWPSAAAMAEELDAILDGRCRVQCSATFVKRMLRELGRSVDRRPRMMTLAALLVTVAFVVLLGLTVARALAS